MMNSRKFSTIVAAVVIAILSIYAVDPSTFVSANHTTQAVTVTLQLQSGTQTIVSLPPGAVMPTNFTNDAVMGATLYGVYIPAGANAVVANPTGGKVSLTWQMDGGVCYGGAIDPYEAG